MQELPPPQKKPAPVFVSSEVNKTSIAYTKSLMEQYYPYLIYRYLHVKHEIEPINILK